MATCQICGREIKNNNKAGLIANHGYRRPGHGWQTASCGGAHELPYEWSHKRIAFEMERNEKAIPAVRARLADFIANPPAELTDTSRRGSYIRQPLKTFRRPDDFDAQRPRNVWRSYGSEFAGRVRSMEAEIKQRIEFGEFLRERFEAWEPDLSAMSNDEILRWNAMEIDSDSPHYEPRFFEEIGAEKVRRNLI